eukprot:TRINITY_DN1651_c0_g1_i1.p1 TRINITY_DN1651_c0_g1~~TRINITY_DN1651_c0_g1_i1.p1  ORF type:complete len:170 (-),score=73.54 TRINITY_DN1651_c0_g1_i1:4-492(-)
MLPLSLLKAGQGHPLLIELKNGQTFNGRLASCDSFMNINLQDVIWTSKDGDRFWKIPSCYIRGSTIKYMCLPSEVIQQVPKESPEGADGSSSSSSSGRGRGGRGGSSYNSRGGGGHSGRGGAGGYSSSSSSRGGSGGGNSRGGRGGGSYQSRGGRGGYSQQH